MDEVPVGRGDLSQSRRIEPRRVGQVDRVVGDVGVEVGAVVVADGVGRQEPAEGGIVGAGGEDLELGLVVAALAGVAVDDARARGLTERAVGVGVADAAVDATRSQPPASSSGVGPEVEESTRSGLSRRNYGRVVTVASRLPASS